MLLFFFFNDTATTEIYALSLHDALPIFQNRCGAKRAELIAAAEVEAKGTIAELQRQVANDQDRKSTRLNSSHSQISYAVFCLKKKKNRTNTRIRKPPDARIKLSMRHSSD